MKKTELSKGIAIGAILLFIGASIVPSINGNVGQQNPTETILNSEISQMNIVSLETDRNNLPDWSTYQHDNTRNGVTDVVGADYDWEEKLTYNIGERVLSPVVGDLDGDGNMDAVFSSDVTGPNLPVYAIDLVTGELKWSFEDIDSAVWSTPTLADLNDDGKLDVVFGVGSNDARIVALYHDGTFMWDYFTGDSSNSIDGASGVADVDGDGKPEVLVGGSCYYCPSCDTFFVLNGEDGSLLWGVNLGSTLVAPAIGEFDGDPGVEIVMGGYDGYARVFDGENGHEIWAIQPDASGWIESTPAIVDYGSDGIDDIAVFSGNSIYLLNGSNGNTIWSYPTAGSGLFGGISAGDIDEDEEPEILAYPYYTGFVYAINLDGTLKWTRNVGSDYTYASPSPAIVDIDGDTHPEAIVQARSGTLYSLNGDTGDVENSFTLGGTSIASPAIADIDRDNIADIITSCDDGNLYVIGNPTLPAFVIEGNCYYPNMDPVDDIEVDIINLDSDERWQASTNNNHYSLVLNPGSDINAGETLRIIARDDSESVNVTNRIVTEDDITAGTIQLDLILDIHYRDLKKFPFYYAESGGRNVNQMCGAAVAQMMLNYLFWNSTTDPEPPMLYDDQQVLFDAFASGEYVTGDDMWQGLNEEIPGYPDWEYGYFFNPAHNTSADEVLKRICVWLDYPVNYYNDNWPKLGHPMHVPVAIPAYGDYSNWMVVRGIHTDQDAWIPIPETLNIYGFWLNDPHPEGLGGNTYVTVQTFLNEYFFPLDVPGDEYDTKYLAIVEPPEGIEEPEIVNDINLKKVESPAKFNSCTEKLISYALSDKAPSLFKELANNAIIEAAYTGANSVLMYDNVYSEMFAEAELAGKPVYNGNYAIVEFTNNKVIFAVQVGIHRGELQQIQIR